MSQEQDIDRSSLASVLAQATGLSPGRAEQIYRSGYPWPLFSRVPACRAILHAQTHQVSLGEASNAIKPECLAEGFELNLLRRQALQDPRRMDELFEAACASSPAMREMVAHANRVTALTGESLETIYRIFLALESFAVTHPAWNQDELSRGVC